MVSETNFGTLFSTATSGETPRNAVERMMGFLERVDTISNKSGDGNHWTTAALPRGRSVSGQRPGVYSWHQHWPCRSEPQTSQCQPSPGQRAWLLPSGCNSAMIECGAEWCRYGTPSEYDAHNGIGTSSEYDAHNGIGTSSEYDAHNGIGTSSEYDAHNGIGTSSEYDAHNGIGTSSESGRDIAPLNQRLFCIYEENFFFCMSS